MNYFFLILLFCTSLFGAFEKKGVGASTVALSLSGVASEEPSFAVFNNVALISNSFSSEMFYRNYYGISGYDLSSIAVSGQLFSLPISMGITRYGTKLFSETELALGVAYELNKNVLIGASTNVYFLNIKNHGNASTLGFSFSMIYILSEQLRIGGLLSNLNEPVIGEVNETLPVSGTIGIAFKPVKQVELLLDVYKEDYHEFDYRVGARIHVMEYFHLLTGFQNSINSFSAGIEFNMDWYSVSYAIDIHPTLSASNAIGFNYVF